MRLESSAQFAAPVLDGNAGLAVLDGANPTLPQEQAPPIVPQPAQPASTTLADLARETDLLARQFDRKAAAQTTEPPIEQATPLGTAAAREPVDTAPPAPPPAAAAYVGEPSVDPQWLAERETALVAIRADYEAARAQALTAPGPGWIEATGTLTDESGQRRSADGRELVFVSDPNAPPVLAGYDESGNPLHQPAGRWMEFNEDAFAAHFRAQDSAPLQALATLYDTDVPGLFAQHPQIWSIATADHALNAGPAPAGHAMGDPGQLGMLDLYMADPQIAALIDAYGGQPTPASGDIALEQVRIHGQQRYEQMSRLGNAMASVRNQYTDALGQAQTSGSGPGWIERARTVTLSDESGRQTTQPLLMTDENGQPQRDSTGQPLVAMERVFDPDAFTDWYTQQGGLQHQAFKSFYGQSHTRYGTDESGQSIVTAVDFDNPKWSLAGVGGQMRHNDLQGIDPNDPPRLRNRSAVGFDLEAGWATAHDNIKHKSDWIDSVFQVAFTAVAAWFGAVTLGPAAASAMGMTTTTAAGTAALTTAGTIVSGAVAGATTSVVSGIMSDNLTLKGILQGALSGGLTAGLMDTFGAAAARQAGAAGTVALRMTVQGGIQELLGGKFRDGALAALASGVADLAGANMLKGIDNAFEAGTMNAAEAFAAKGLARMFGSALRALGSPGDPAYAFASAFVSDMVNAGLDAGAQGHTSETDADMASRQRVPPTDPFGVISDDAEIPYGDALADELGLSPGDLVDAGWTTELGRSAEVLRGFAEGTGFSLLSTGEAIIEVMRSPRQFINGVGLLLSSAEAREQLGDELVNRARIDVQMMEEAFAAGDLRGTAQQLGKLTADLAQVAGGVEAITRLGVSASTAGGRLVLGAMDDLAEAALHKIPSLFDAGGRPLMDFRALTTAQKQIIGETMGAEAVGRLVPDAQRIGRLPTVGQQGIDDLYKVKRPDVDYLLVEYKFGTSRLGNTVDGVQMSDGWLQGTVSNYNRILEAVGNSYAVADSVTDALRAGRIERWVVHTDPFGNVSVGMVDAAGRFIPKPVSNLLRIKP